MIFVASSAKNHTVLIYIYGNLMKVPFLSFAKGITTDVGVWFAIMALMGNFILIAGHGATGLWIGVFIDPRNQISLSRVQMALWTVLVLSAWLTAVLTNNNISLSSAAAMSAEYFTHPGHEVNLRYKYDAAADAEKERSADFLKDVKVIFDGHDLHPVDVAITKFREGKLAFRLPAKYQDKDGKPVDWTLGQEVAIAVKKDGKPIELLDTEGNPQLALPYRVHTSPIEVAIPQELWLAMGISIASLVGTPLLLSAKRAPDPDPELQRKTLENAPAAGVKNATNDPRTDGLLLTKRCPSDAGFADMFRGDEIANGLHLDLAKIQMAFFTLALLVTYSTQVYQLFSETPRTLIASLPTLSQGFVALLFLSHTGYLSSKAVTRTPTDTGKPVSPSTDDGRTRVPADAAAISTTEQRESVSTHVQIER